MTRSAICTWRRALCVAAALITLVGSACSDQGPAPNGAARITLRTRGFDLDSDGYGVRVDAGPPEAIPINWVTIVSSLSPGPHTIALEGLAANCVVSGANPRSVTIVAGETADVAFAVGCTTTFAVVSAGGSQTCGLTAGGAAYCWGYDVDGQLGDGSPGTARPQTSPVAVLGGISFAAVSAGDFYACGIGTGGAAYCWGDNQYGQLDDGTGGPNGLARTSPVAVLGGIRFATVSAGGLHACGVAAGGVAYCWGANDGGFLGDGTTTQQTRPVAVAGGLTFVSMSAGWFHTCGVATGGAAYCWGYNVSGQLGDGTTIDQTRPVPVLGGIGFAVVSAGGSHSCGVATGGAAYCWGNNGQGMLGDGTTTSRSSPVVVLGGLTFSAVSAGEYHSCGVTTGGAAYCWGDNEHGELGDGTLINRTSPVPVVGALRFATVSTGNRYHTCGETTGGLAFCWGDNHYGQLGDGTTTSSSVPVKVAGQP